MNKLDFGFLAHEDILEAWFDGGYYHISYCGKGFNVTVSTNGNLGYYKDIYDALDAANNHYWEKNAEN